MFNFLIPSYVYGDGSILLEFSVFLTIQLALIVYLFVPGLKREAPTDNVVALFRAVNQSMLPSVGSVPPFPFGFRLQYHNNAWVYRKHHPDLQKIFF
jgi:hypothetical protein